jgi:SAM-dependent methyltransferase
MIVPVALPLRALLNEAGRVLRATRRRLRALRPQPRWLREKAVKDRMFDALHGVDTGGVVELSDLSVDTGNRRFGVDYIGVDPDEFHSAMSALDIVHEDFVFVDLGSGKGRALLLAAEYRFRRTVGVEFAPELHRAAESNLARHARLGQRRCSFELHCIDAADFPLPGEPLVVFLYNPFGLQVMRQVARNVRAAWRSLRREIYVVYCNPFERRAWDAEGFREIASGGHFVVFTPGQPQRLERLAPRR